MRRIDICGVRRSSRAWRGGFARRRGRRRATRRAFVPPTRRASRSAARSRSRVQRRLCGFRQDCQNPQISNQSIAGLDPQTTFGRRTVSRPPRSKGDAAMKPRVLGRSRSAGGRADGHAADLAAARCSDTAMEPRVPDTSCAARLGDQHQVRCCKLRVVRRGRHGLGAERDQRCQHSTSRGKTGGPKHRMSPPNCEEDDHSGHGACSQGQPTVERPMSTCPSVMGPVVSSLPE